MIVFEKKFEKKNLDIKKLKYFNRTWQLKVIRIFKSNNLTLMSMPTSFFGKMREHKLEYGRLKEDDKERKRKKIV